MVVTSTALVLLLAGVLFCSICGGIFYFMKCLFGSEK